MKDLRQLKDQFENFLNSTIEAREASERDTDYDDHKQWTAEEVDKLEARGQAPVVINRVKTKVNLLTGIQRRMRTKPRGLPRNPSDEGGADAVTKALRFVVDNADFEQTSSEAFRKEVVWGYGGAIVEYDPASDEIVVNEIPSDRYFYDPHSEKRDFSDKTFDGIAIWMDAAMAKEMFPGNDELIDGSLGEADHIDGLEDKPEVWVDTKRKRLRVIQHFYLDAKGWMQAFYVFNGFLTKEGKELNGASPYKDKNGRPINPIEMQSAYIDRENNRYGEVRSYVWLQDEINHRRSKLLYLLSVRQTRGEKGAVADVGEMKKELARADGHVEINPNMEWDILPTGDMAEGQFRIYQESKAELEGFGANSVLQGNPQQEMSGRAVQLLQQGGISELSALFDGHKHWEQRIYRQIWARIKQFWDSEKWIRITDNEDDLKWVGLNQPVTFGDQLKEAAENGSQEAQEALQFGLANQDPRLNQVVETRNQVSELDIDVILTESPDFVTIRQEQFADLAELAKAYGPQAVPFEVMLELSEIPGKETVKEMLRGDPKAAAEAAELQQAATQIQFQEKALDLEGKQLDNVQTAIENEQKLVETERLKESPPENVSVSV